MREFIQELIDNDVMGVDIERAKEVLEQSLSYEEVIEQDIKTTLKEHYGYGEASIEQFWKLEGESICDETYQAISDTLAEKEVSYNIIIGDISV